jgi:EmrB/QacA subfamily drug resistance transporter
VTNGYLLALGALMLVGGALGDAFGARRAYVVGVVGFGATSLLCAVAPTIEVLVVARILQGAFGALLTPNALALLLAAYRAPQERSAAIGSWTAWTGIATVIGPVVGGQLIDVASWRWVFALNVPFVVAAVLLVRAAGAPEGAVARADGPVDWLGGALSFAGLGLPVFALIRQPAVGWGALEVWAPLALGVGVLAAFVAWERRAPRPMLPGAIFRRPNVAWGNVETALVYAGLSAMGFFLVVFLQQVAGWSALEAGMALLPVTLLLFGLSRRAGEVAARLGPRRFMGFGPLVAAAGLASLARLDADVDYVTDVLPGVLLFGLGLAATVAPLTSAVLASADEATAGITSAVNTAVARVAGLVAIAAVGVAVAAHAGAGLDERLAGIPLGPADAAVVADARERAIARIEPGALDGPRAGEVAGAVTGAAVEGARLAMAISAALVAAGGLVGLARIR